MAAVAADALTPGAIVEVVLEDDEPMCLGQLHDGTPFSVAPRCSWCTSALADGVVLGASVTCCTCFSVFCVHTGAALHPPALVGVRVSSVVSKQGRFVVAPPAAADVEPSVGYSDAGTSAIVSAVLGGSASVQQQQQQQQQDDAAAEEEADENRTVIIAGGGAAGASAALALRALGFPGRVVLVSADTLPPYDRTALSKRSVGAADEIALRPEAAWENAGVELELGVSVEDVDVEAKIVGLSDGRALTYGQLLLAPGGAPRSLPGVEADSGAAVFALRSLADASALRERLDAAAAAEEPAHVVVAGAGLLGVEVAAMLGRDRARVGSVTLVGVQRPCEGVFGEAVAASVSDWLAVEAGVDVRATALINAIEPNAAADRAVSVVLDSGESIDADVCVLAVGSDPNTHFLAGSEAIALDTEGAIIVDHQLRAVSDGSVFAAGEAAAAPGAPRAVHWTAAVAQGQAAARAMLGLPGVAASTPAPTFALQLLGLPLQFVGEPAEAVIVDGDLTADAEHGARPCATLYFHDGERVTGVLAVDRPDAAAAAAHLLLAGRLPAPEDITAAAPPDLLALAVAVSADGGLGGAGGPESAGGAPGSAPGTAASDAEAEEREQHAQQLRVAIDDVDRTGAGHIPVAALDGVLKAAGLDLDEEELEEARAFLCEPPAALVSTEDLVRWWVS